MSEKKTFEYTYASPLRQREDERAREPMDKVTLRAIAFGGLGCALFVAGMVLSLHSGLYVLGGTLGILGIAGMACTPRFYHFLNRRRKAGGRH